MTIVLVQGRFWCPACAVLRAVVRPPEVSVVRCVCGTEMRPSNGDDRDGSDETTHTD